MRGHEKLHAADFRTGTMFKNTVAMVHGHPRVFTTWGRCRLHALDQVCEEPQIVLTHFDNGGATWSRAWPHPHDRRRPASSATPGPDGGETPGPRPLPPLPGTPGGSPGMTMIRCDGVCRAEQLDQFGEQRGEAALAPGEAGVVGDGLAQHSGDQGGDEVDGFV
jgi:hypothetical protein